jgi:hypothetical protein
MLDDSYYLAKNPKVQVKTITEDDLIITMSKATALDFLIGLKGENYSYGAAYEADSEALRVYFASK